MARRTSGRVYAFRRTPLFAAIACAIAQGAVAGTFYVDNGNDSGGGSLRQAINDANNDCAVNFVGSTITFRNGPFTIQPSSPLPDFNCSGVQYNVTLDASSQGISYGAVLNTDPTGFNATFGAKLDGSLIPYGGVCGLRMVDNSYGGQLSVKGMEIINFNYGGSGWGLCGNIRATGNRLANNANGMGITAGSVIGTYLPEDRNVIVGSSGADRSAIELNGGYVTIQNNLIGTRDGITADPNYYGIFFDCCSEPTGYISNNVIASTFANIAVSNDSLGIYDNKIGVNAAGTALLGTASYGIALYYSYGASISGNTIGGASNGIRNEQGNSGFQRSAVRVTDNKIGVTTDGSAALPNNIGINDVNSYGTNIYGNEISGNAQYGIWLEGSVGATVSQNFIGTNYGGTLAVPNKVGVYLGISPSGTFNGNTISGNTWTGLWSSDASNVILNGNMIGTTTDKSGAIPNGWEGVLAECGSNIVLTSNTISNNRWAGVSLAGISSGTLTSNTIASNGSGLNAANGVELVASTCGLGGGQLRGQAIHAPSVTAGVPNYSNGNTFASNTITGNTAHGVYVFGANNNTFDGNTIVSNAGDGILLESDATSFATGNRITKGSNYANGLKNIELGNGTPNNRQERPVVTSAVRNPGLGTTTVTVDLAANVGEYVLELFSNSAPGKPAGEQYLATSLDINVAVAGPVTYTFTVPDVTSDNFSATATHKDTADTSEFADIRSANPVPVPAVNILPTSIDFGDVVVGRQSSPNVITITSQGTADYVISALRDASCTGPSICSTGSFVCSTSCVEGTGYAANMSCSINATFAPTVLGPQSKTLMVCDNTTGSPRSLSLAGNGVPVPAVDISFAPSYWYFGEVLVNTQGPGKSFRLSNAGTNQVFLGPVTVAGDFVTTGNTCGATLAGGASCAVEVAFAPVVKGLVSGSLDVSGSNAPLAVRASAGPKVTAGATTGAAQASLQGTGLQFGDLRLPNAISFGTLTLHGSLAHQSVVLSNTGNGTLAISSISIAGPFAMSNGCGATLATGGSCTVTLDFNPLTLGTFNGTLSIVSDAPGGTRAIPVNAVVIAESRPVVTVDRSTAGFGDRVAGTETPGTRINIKNEGSQEAILGTVSITSDTGAVDFLIRASTCGGTLAPQASCFAEVYMKPSGFGPRSATLLVPSNSRESPAHVDLTGTGCRPFGAGANRSGARSNCAP